MNSIGERLRQLRQSRGMTLEEVGEHVGVTREAVRAWESNEYKPKYESLRKLAELFETTVESLVDA